MGDQHTKDIGASLDDIINTVEVIDAVESIDEKLDTAIELSNNLKEFNAQDYKIKDSTICGCGGHYVPKNKTRHAKTKRHQSYEETQALLPENLKVIV